VNIYNPNSQLSGRTLSEQDGYYSYLGLAPGDYEVKIDSAQLKKLKLLSFPEKQSINIKKSLDGDVVEGIDFTLSSTAPKAKDTTHVTVPKPVEQVETHEIEQTFLQVGAFIDKKNANRAAKTLSATIHYPVEVFFEDGWYKVRFGPFTDKKDVELCKNAIVGSRMLAENLIKEVHQTKSEKVHLQADRSITQTTTVSKPENEPVIPQKGPEVPRKVPAMPKFEPSIAENIGNVTFTEKPVTLNELSKGDNILKKHYYVQIAAFSNQKNATRLIKRITRMIPYSVGIVYREQYYKVRYGPFETQEELNDCIRLIVKAGILQKELMKIFYEEIGSTPVADQPHLLDGYHVQVGAFRDKANATRFFRQMSADYPYPILMIEEDGYYKVRFGPFKSMSDTKKCRKVLVDKVKDCFMRSNTVKYF
jgi:cell division protein FtsN